MEVDSVEFKWFGNSSVQIKNSRVIYIDPFKLPEDLEKADFILITHSHYDHCSLEDISKVVKEGTTILVPADAQSKVTRLNVRVNIHIIEPNKETSFGELRISTLPAYNIDKAFHPKEEGWMGYLIKMGSLLFYHAGDTDLIPEMQKLTGFKGNGNKLVSFLPVGGRFTMTAEEAFEAAKVIRPWLAIPIHYGTIAGSEEDAEEFVSLCKEEGIEAQILGRGD